jgi:hypothetical protein
MNAPRLSVRARLALWHAGVLTLIVCVFSAGILFFVRESLFAGVDRQLHRALTTVDWVYQHEPEDIADLPTESGIAFFRVVVDGKLFYQTGDWERAGLTGAAVDPGTAPDSWKGSDGTWCRCWPSPRTPSPPRSAKARAATPCGR